MSEPVATVGKILIVEDERMLLSAVAKMLRKKQYNVLEAADGTMAVDLLWRHKDEVALVFLDANLPGLSGREVLQEARRIQPRTPVILTSAFTQSAIDSSFAGLNFEHFIRKPYRLAALVDVLQQFIAAP